MTNFDRREFVLLAGAATLATALPGRAGASTSNDAITPYRISV